VSRLEAMPLEQGDSNKERLMTDKENTALIPLPAGALQNLGTGPKNILSVMVSDALALARQQEQERSLALVRFRLGNFEFRDPDYRQILIWAKALELEPEVFIDQLEHSFEFEYERYESGLNKFLGMEENVALEVEDGCITHLKWNFKFFPIPLVECVDGLRIKRLGFFSPMASKATRKISLRLPLLTTLDCADNHLSELDLSNVPALTMLFCLENQLSELDIRHLKKLKLPFCDPDITLLQHPTQKF
jgi:Leucine-rich repeat (LRR) protein